MQPSSPHATSACWVPSALWDREDRNQSLGQWPRKVGMLGICFSLLFFSPGRSWKLRVFSVKPHWAVGRDHGQHVPWIFLPAFYVVGFAFASGSGASYLVFGFFTKEMGPCIVFESVSLWRKKGLGLPISPPWYLHLTFILFLTSNICGLWFHGGW